jgi:hypothetical protein
MAQEHLNSLITSAGIEAADIEAILALPADAKPEDFKVDDYVGKIKTNIETQVKNDPKFWEGLNSENIHADFKKRLESEQYGRAANITRQKVLKGLGLTEADIADLPDEDKNKLEVFVTKAAEKFAATKTSDKQLQQQLVETRKKLEDLELDIPTREGKIKQDYETKYNSEKLDFIILAELATVENLKAPAQYLVKELAAALKEENAFEINGLSAVPMQKSNPKLKILEGSKEVSLKDLIVKKLTADGLIAAPAAPGKNGGTVTVDVNPDGKGGLGISSHIMDKITANTPKD